MKPVEVSVVVVHFRESVKSRREGEDREKGLDGKTKEEDENS